jgi:hypothetical protein
MPRQPKSRTGAGAHGQQGGRTIIATLTGPPRDGAVIPVVRALAAQVRGVSMHWDDQRLIGTITDSSLSPQTARTRLTEALARRNITVRTG